jgi:hypothetical protein
MNDGEETFLAVVAEAYGRWKDQCACMETQGKDVNRADLADAYLNGLLAWVVVSPLTDTQKKLTIDRLVEMFLQEAVKQGMLVPILGQN